MSSKMGTGESPVAEAVKTFALFDPQNTGFMNSKDLTYCMQKVGNMKLNEDEMKKMLAIADPNNTGKIDYEKFIKELTGG